jgi:hypothetical protein
MRFTTLLLTTVAGCAANHAADALRRELLEMVRVDQAARAQAVTAGFAAADVERVQEIDRKNTARLHEIVARRGWPGNSIACEDGAHAAWLLVQHADHDRAFQRECLILLERAIKAGEASPTDLAYLTDRLLVAEGKPQLYGTQFQTAGGAPAPHPIADEADVDRRRAEVGLGPLEAYREEIRKLYAPPPPQSR